MSFASCRRLGSYRVALERALVWGSLLCYLAAASGVPLPAPGASRPGQAYPCQQGRCGCGSAHQCWTSCCCHTPRERLAWAQRHGVKPPVDLLALVPKAPISPAGKRGLDCCAAPGDAGHDPAQSALAGKRQARTIVAIEALRCRGASTLWVTSGAATLPPVFEHRVAFLPAGWVASLNRRAASPSFVPDDPPPRGC